MASTWDKLCMAEEITQLYNKKKNRQMVCSIDIGKENYYLKNGWEIKRTFKKKMQLVKDKPDWEYFEDRVWCILAKMGFSILNKDNNFKIDISRDQKVNPKQIDIFGMSGETVLLIECKYSNVIKKQNIKDELTKIKGYRESLLHSVYKHFSSNVKIGWIFATYNYIINDSDRALADEANVIILESEDIEYYEKLVSHLGPASKYQLFADVFGDKKIPELELQVPATRGNMGNHQYYSFTIEPSKLLPIAFVSHRKKNDRGSTISYQRMINKNRLKNIKKYIENEKGFFPNNIIINFHTGKNLLRFDTSVNIQSTEAQHGILSLPNRYKSAWIIDGQHRLYGFSGTEEADTVTIPVVAFENLDAGTQAKMFVDINSKQKQVNRNLLEDLYSDLLIDSDIEDEMLLGIISKITKQLNNDIDSPLFGKIASPTGKKNPDTPLTLTTVTRALKKNNLIASVYKNNNNKLKPGPLYSMKEPIVDNTLYRSTFILKNYFKFFSEGIPHNWALGSREGGFLCTNNGISALLILLREIFDYLKSETIDDLYDISAEEIIEELYEIIQPVISYLSTATYSEYLHFRRQQGGAGQLNVSLALMDIINQKYTDFHIKKVNNYRSERDSDRNEIARGIMPNIQLLISNHVIGTLKTEFSKGESDWWYRGVPEKVRIDISKRVEEDHEHKDREQYFDLLHYQKIISNNWNMYKEVYAFKEDGRTKEKQVHWFVILNQIRNKIAHPERGTISIDELEFLYKVDRTLKDRLES